ncbi:uncharacterized protein LOC125370271 [Ricinus communis]|uniref:uncharacterized protein LOC125370271 n=1 Tax=Ricinus communis TaxID=3988 RepID=UPI00201A83D7|nr:uncharacterized protein LOC125370271 [Ricinus communis]
MVQLSEKSSAIIERRLLKKLKDPRGFTIPYFIGNVPDLGASISVIPYNLFKKLELEEPKPTIMSIQLAVYSKRIIEDVLVNVQEFIFLMDFVIMDMDESVDVYLILGKLFLATARAGIDFHDGLKRNLQVNELDEWRLHAYENVPPTKKRTKRRHDSRIKPKREFQAGDKVLLSDLQL